MKKILFSVSYFMLLLGYIFLAFGQSSAFAATNLIANPSVETANPSNAKLPQSWAQGRWGTNTTTFGYLTTGAEDGTRGLNVQISKYSSGDAKWYFTPVAVTAGSKYTFSDYYQSNVSTTITAQFDNGNGKYTYQDLGVEAASSTWKQASVNFTVPSGIKKVTIFHLINKVGSLTTDNFSLTSASTTPPPPVAVPNVVGLTQAAATSAITGAGLVLGTVTTQSSSTVASGTVISENPVAGTSVSAGSSVNLVVSTGPAAVSVPNVVGLTQAAATSAITGAGLVLGTVTTQSSSTVASGTVISENPAAGTSVSAGSSVSLVVSSGSSGPPAVSVPNVVGLTQAAATSAITGAGLVVGTITTQSSSTVASGKVISENPVAGTSVAAGSSVNLVVSTGPAPVAVPNVVGLTQAAATSAITGAGLVVGTITTQSSSTVPSGKVISQSPTASTSVAAGSSVNLVVSSGPAQVSVPNVVGLTQGAATTAITGAGLVLGTVTSQSSGTVASGNVISQSPTASTSVAAGSSVNLVVSTGPANTAPKTIISLTFDDGRASQINVGKIMADHGVHATFYINSIQLDSGSWYMSLASVQQLAGAGNEIGGHTLTHPDLTTLSATNAISEICGDQAQLQAWGFPAVSFAYPYGASNSAVEGYVHSCKEKGYAVSGDYVSARGAWGLQSPGDPISNTLPPQDPYLLLTPAAVQTSTTLSDLQAMVTNAEKTGGFVPIQFHSVCSAPSGAPFPGNADDCVGGDTYAVTYSVLDQFVAWLAARTSLGTVVLTVGQAMGVLP